MDILKQLYTKGTEYAVMFLSVSAALLLFCYRGSHDMQLRTTSLCTINEHA